VYLPLDTKKNAQQFLQLVHPDLVFLSNMNTGPIIYWLKNQILKKPDFLGFLEKNQLFLNGAEIFIETLDAFTYFCSKWNAYCSS
jgi:3-deoxy-D-manno-octulosonic-acid transferase